jgi:hypothetical protein
LGERLSKSISLDKSSRRQIPVKVEYFLDTRSSR